LSCDTVVANERYIGLAYSSMTSVILMQFCDISIERKLFISVLFLEKKGNKLCTSVPILHAFWSAITYWKCYGKLRSTNKNTCRIRENTQGACFILNVS